MSLAGLSWLESRTGQEAECRAHADGGAGPVRQPRHPLGRGVGVVLAQRARAVRWETRARHSGTCRRSTPARGATRRGRPRPLTASRSWSRPAAAGPHRRGDQDGCGVRRGVADAKGQPWARARARRCLGLVAGDDFDAAVRRGAGPARGDARPLRGGAHRAGVRRSGCVVPDGGSMPGCSCRRALDDVRRVSVRRCGRDQAATELDLTGERVPRPPAGRHRGAHPAGAAGGPPARRRAYDEGGRRGAVPEPEDRGVPPAQGLHEARRALARAAGRGRGRRPRGSGGSASPRCPAPAR